MQRVPINLFFFALALVFSGRAAAAPLSVLHWWTSASERAAVEVLSERLRRENIEWVDQPVPGGAGVGAIKVLRSRALAGHLPDVAQLAGTALAEWASRGLLLELTEVAQAGRWSGALHPTVARVVHYRDHVIGVPLGIHRVNTMLYNRRIFDRLGLRPPRDWREFELVARRLIDDGIVPLARVSEPWQVATLFESLLLVEGGTDYYRRLFVERDPQAFLDERFGRALQRLRELKPYMTSGTAERPWVTGARQLADGQVAMLIGGDWAKGELLAWGFEQDVDWSCAAAPGTAAYHLYSIDTLAMIAGNYSQQGKQERMAAAYMSPALQAAYNRAKGSIPARRDVRLPANDACAEASLRAFSRGPAAQAPSLVHRMVAGETFKEAIIAAVHRVFQDPTVNVGETQRRLASLVAMSALRGSREDAQDSDRGR